MTDKHPIAASDLDTSIDTPPLSDPIGSAEQRIRDMIDELRETGTTHVGAGRNDAVGGYPFELSGIVINHAVQAARDGDYETAWAMLELGESWPDTQISSRNHYQLALRAVRAGQFRPAARIVLRQLSESILPDSDSDIPEDKSLRNELAHLLAMRISSVSRVLAAMSDHRKIIGKNTISEAEQTLRTQVEDMIGQLEKLRTDGQLPGHDLWPGARENLLAIVSYAQTLLAKGSSEVASRLARIDPVLHKAAALVLHQEHKDR